MTTPRDTITPTVLTVQRGMQVLRAFRSGRAPLTNAELVQRTGLPKSTVSRLTTTLLHLGYLRHVPGGRAFELGSASASIGHAYIGNSALMEIASPFLQELADKLETSVALGIRDGLEILYVGYRASHKVSTLRLGVGSVLPLGTTAIGRAYLWGLEQDTRSELLRQLSTKAEQGAATLTHGIQRSFRELALTGVCSVLSGYQRDAFGIARPLQVGRRRAVMSMSCGKAKSQPDLEVESRLTAPALIEATTRLQNALKDFDNEL